MKYVESGSDYSHSVGYEFDTLNNLTRLVETINGVKHTTSYAYDEDNRLERTVCDNITQTYDYDSWGRMFESSAWFRGTCGVTKSYFYTALPGGRTSAQVYNYQADTPEFIVNFDLTYDDNGNITSVEYGTTHHSYAYDSANQLIRENNSGLGKTWVWAYDNAGNILSRTEYAYTTGVLGSALDTVVYTYGDASWGDLLTAYNGQSITYDTIGNPLNDGTWTYTWQHGRELASMSDGETTWTYTYDANGMRKSRSNGSTTYNYVYNGGKLIQMTRGTDTLEFYYDALGVPVVVKYNGEVYNYVTTLQGDVLLILDTDGEIAVEYAYDAWGGHVTVGGTMANTLGTLNPLTYRGYVYDTETGLYYLQSRYYNPEIGRFINADNYPTTGQGLTGNNMFAYCGNNPVNRKDDGGEFWNVVIGAIVGAAVSAATTAIQTYKETGHVDIGKTVISGLVGAISGGVAATGIGMVTQAAISAGTTFVADVATQKICENKSWREVNFLKAGYNGVVAGGTSLFGSALGGITSAGYSITGNELITAGKDKLLTGYVKQSLGQSHSKLLKQGRKLVEAGTKCINTGRGISSVTGTLLTWGVGQEYSWS